MLVFKLCVFCVSRSILSMFGDIITTIRGFRSGLFRNIALGTSNEIRTGDLRNEICTMEETSFTSGVPGMQRVNSVIDNMTMDGHDYATLCSEELAPRLNPETGEPIQDADTVNKGVAKQIIDQIVLLDQLREEEEMIIQRRNHSIVRFFFHRPYLLLTPSSFDFSMSLREYRSCRRMSIHDMISRLQ